MLTKPTIKLDLEGKSNGVLLIFAQTLLSMLTGNLNYPAIVNPTLLQFAAMVTDFSAALAAWGLTGNRGSHVQLLAVENTRAALEVGIVGLSTHCMNVTPYDAAALASGGFELKSEANPVGTLAAPIDLRQVIDKQIMLNKVKISWKRPLDTPKGAVKFYALFRSTTPLFGNAVPLTGTTKTSFIDGNLTLPNYYYWVMPFNAAGAGEVSDMLVASVSLQPV